MTAEQQQQQQQQQQHQQQLHHFQHYIRSDYGSDSVSLNSKLRHYSLTETTNFIVRKTSTGNGGAGGSSITMALPVRQINGRSNSYGSLQ